MTKTFDIIAAVVLVTLFTFVPYNTGTFVYKKLCERPHNTCLEIPVLATWALGFMADLAMVAALALVGSVYMVCYWSFLDLANDLYPHLRNRIN